MAQTKKMKIVFIMVIITFAGFFCKTINFPLKNKASETDIFIFGADGGSLPGNYTYFKIENEKLYRNLAFAPGQETILFNTNPLLNDKYLLTKELKDNFPGYLLSHPNQTFGCPNCADQGAVHIEIEHNGTLKSWDIDTDINRQPAEIRAYIKKLLQIVSQL